jgi:hypothetical protein
VAALVAVGYELALFAVRFVFKVMVDVQGRSPAAISPDVPPHDQAQSTAAARELCVERRPSAPSRSGHGHARGTAGRPTTHGPFGDAEGSDPSWSLVPRPP